MGGRRRQNLPLPIFFFTVSFVSGRLSFVVAHLHVTSCRQQFITTLDWKCILRPIHAIYSSLSNFYVRDKNLTDLSRRRLKYTIRLMITDAMWQRTFFFTRIHQTIDPGSAEQKNIIHSKWFDGRAFVSFNHLCDQSHIFILLKYFISFNMCNMHLHTAWAGD